MLTICKNAKGGGLNLLVIILTLFLISCTQKPPTVSMTNDINIEGGFSKISYIAKAEAIEKYVNGEYITCKFISEIYCTNETDLGSIGIQFDDTVAIVQLGNQHFETIVYEESELYLEYVNDAIYNLWKHDESGFQYVDKIDTKGNINTKWKYN